MKRIFVLPLLMISCNLSAQGGNNNALGFPSTNNSFLAKETSSGNVGVDLYTGMAQVSVPICNLVSRELSIPVSVDYADGRGVKVQEYASQVGLGWQLNAGGSISRVVRGFPDEQPNGYLGTGTSPGGVLNPGQRWGQVATTLATNGTVTSNQQLSLIGTYPGSFNAVPTADGEPDIFYVKTPFFSFQFVFNTNGIPVFPNSTGYQVKTTNFFNTSSPAPSFEVIDDQGNQFYFGTTTQSTEQSTDSLYNVPTTYISTWYLDKIVTYNSKDIINLTYQAGITNDITYNYSWSEAQNVQNVITLSTGKNIIAQPKYVSTITSSLGEIDFAYATFTRLDDNNAAQLSSIILKAYNPLTASNSTTLQTFNFNYGYFGLPSTDPNVLRLKLNGITVTGNTTATSTPLTLATFGYNTTDLPNRTWPIFDYWGYCNSTTQPTSPDIASISRDVNASTLQADILNSVYTMQGGIWQIYYEPNVYGANVDGLRVYLITQVLPTGNLSKKYEYIYANGNPSGEIMSANYTQNYFLFTTSALTLSGSPFIINDVNGNFIGYSSVKATAPNGGYTFYTFSNFNDQTDQDGETFNDAIPVSWTDGSNPFPVLVASIDLAFKRGLPKGQAVYSKNDNQISQTTFIYTPQTALGKDGYGIRGFTFSAQTGSNSCKQSYYSPIENYRLTQTIHTDYDQANPTTATPLTITTTYSYDLLNNRLIQGVSTTDSKGQPHNQAILHADDIANTSPNPNTIPMLTPSETLAINAMIASNRTNVVIHSTDNRNNTINQVHNSYAIIPNGSANNVYLANTTAYTNDPVNTANTLAKQQFFTYDPVFSNLISFNAVGGAPTSVMYSYNTSLPIARIVNANTVTNNEFFFQGFEQNGGNVTTSAHTGNSSYSGSYSVPFTPPNGRSYLIQWWNFTGGAWVFNQQAYTGPITLSGQIDDVRVFPADGMMTTYTYNPLVGKTSETDPSGRSLIYQYDGLNRVQTVRDQDNNILKQYDYQYQLLPATGSTSLGMTGIPGYSSGGPTTGQGTIYGPVGYLVTLTMNASGSPGFPCGLNVQVTGATVSGPTSVTNATGSFTFIMPLSGSVSWSASLVPTGPGGGSFSIH